MFSLASLCSDYQVYMLGGQLGALLQGIWGSTPVGSATKKEISVGETAKRGQLARGQMATKKSSRRKKQRTPKTKRRKRPTKWPRYTLCMVFFSVFLGETTFLGYDNGVSGMGSIIWWHYRTHPISQSTVSRRYSGIRSSL